MKRLLTVLITLTLLLGTWTSGALAQTEEPVVINVFYSSSRIMNEHTDKIHQWAIDNLGVDIQLTLGSNEWKQQLALYITSGEMPDMVGFMDFTTFRAYAEEGVFADLTTVVDKHENIRPYVSAQTSDSDAVWQRLSLDGSIYGIPYMSGAPTKYFNAVRKDWLDKLNLDVPQTLDELTEVLRAFTFDDPDGNGQQDTYGYGAAAFVNMMPFFGAFGATPQEDYLLKEDGSIVTNVISDDYKNALAYLSGIYQEGLIDPEIFTNTSDQVFEKWVRGKYGIWTCWWSHVGNSYLRYGFGEANPEAEVVNLPPPIGPDGFSGHVAADDISSVVGISYLASPEVVEACMRVLDCQATNFGYRIFMYGLEGVHFEMDHETDITTWTYAVNGKDRLGNEITDMEVYKILGNNPVQNQSYLLDDSSASQRMYALGVTATDECPIIRNAFVGLITEESMTYGAELTKYMTEMSIKFITGDANLDTEWDTYVKKYLDMGGEMVRQSLLEVYNQMNGTSYTFAQ